LALRAASAVKIIDASTGAEAASIDIGDDKGTGYVGVFFHPDGRLVGIETGSSVRLIEIPKVRELSRVPLQDTPEFFFAAGGRSFVVLDCLVNDECNGRLRVIDISTGTETNSIDLGPGVTEADLDGDGRTVHVYTQDTEALFDVVTGEKVPSSKDSLDLALSLGEGCKEQSRMTARDRIVVVCENGRVSTIERATGAEIATFELRGSISHFDGFSPDGRYLLAEDKETYRLYETATGFETTVGSFKIRPPVMFQGRTRLFSEDGQHLIVPTSSQRMQLTDISGPRRATLLEVADLEVFYRNHDERLIAVGRNDRFLRIFEAATGKQHSVLRQAGTVRPFQFSPDGKQMVVTREQAIEIIEVATGEVLASLPQRQQFRIIDSHGRFLIAKSGRSASLIDGKNLREIYRFPLGGSSGRSSKIPALGRGEKTVAEVLSEKEPRKGEEPASVSHFAFSPTGDLLATASPEDRKVRLIETASGKEHLRLDLGRELYDVAFSPDGQMLAVDAFDNTVRLIDVATGKETRRLGYQRGPSYITTAKLRFSKDGRLIAVVDWHGLASRMDERIYAWLFDVGTGQPVAQLMPKTDREDPEEPIGLLGWYVDRFSPDSRYFALGATGDDPVRLVKATTGQEVMSIPLGKGLKGVAFSPDSRYLAAVSESGAATLVVTETGETRGYWQHASAITDRDFSPDSRYFATASADGSVRMVDTENGREVARFEHGSPVEEVYFAAGGSSLITVAEDRRLRLWSTDPNWPFEQLCRRRGRNLSREEWRTLFDSDPWEASCPGWHTPAEDTQAAMQTNSKP
jgi:WD40 repeat protein